MTFSSKRGRPRSARPTNDMGTLELQQKRAHGLTQEAIDLCLDRSLITHEHHWCGLHFRWLYTLRYGAPGVSSTMNRLYDAPASRPDDPEWRSAREAEFAEAANLLRHYKRYVPVAQFAIFNERPKFLNEAWRDAAWKNNRLRDAMLEEYSLLKEGLELLQTHWNIAQISPYVTDPPQA